MEIAGGRDNEGVAIVESDDDDDDDVDDGVLEYRRKLVAHIFLEDKEEDIG